VTVTVINQIMHSKKMTILLTRDMPRRTGVQLASEVRETWNM
jgi:hypothetical protein